MDENQDDKIVMSSICVLSQCLLKVLITDRMLSIFNPPLTFPASLGYTELGVEIFLVLGSQ